MPAFLSLVPLKDWLLAAAAVAVIVFYNVHVHDLIVADEHKRDAAVAAESARVMASAQKQIDAQNKYYSDREADTEANYEKQLQDADATHAADLKRLQQLAAIQGSGSTTLDGTAGSGAPADSGGSSLIGLGYVSEELASALRDARADLGACYAERGSLNPSTTGK